MGHPGGLEELGGAGLVTLGDLQARDLRSAASEQFDLDLAKAAADLEHGGVLQPAVGQEADQPLLGSVEAPATVTARETTREPVAEGHLIAAWVAALAHAPSINDSADNATCRADCQWNA